jgi:hypothetical protein
MGKCEQANFVMGKCEQANFVMGKCEQANFVMGKWDRATFACHQVHEQTLPMQNKIKFVHKVST